MNLGTREREIVTMEEKQPVHLDSGKREGRMRLRVGLCGAVGRAAGRVTGMRARVTCVVCMERAEEHPADMFRRGSK